mmetsp:Transcript_2057/g.4286  ORF Transcript_2057/g.4286 Transcript_2057/m.4286 type:complete len:244 (-) Transcript_2057:783-1514(-)
MASSSACTFSACALANCSPTEAKCFSRSVGASLSTGEPYERNTRPITTSALARFDRTSACESERTRLHTWRRVDSISCKLNRQIVSAISSMGFVMPSASAGCRWRHSGFTLIGASAPSSSTVYRCLLSSHATTAPLLPLSSGLDTRPCSTTRVPAACTFAAAPSLAVAPLSLAVAPSLAFAFPALALAFSFAPPSFAFAPPSLAFAALAFACPPPSFALPFASPSPVAEEAFSASGASASALA